MNARIAFAAAGSLLPITANSADRSTETRVTELYKAYAVACTEAGNSAHKPGRIPSSPRADLRGVRHRHSRRWRRWHISSEGEAWPARQGSRALKAESGLTGKTMAALLDDMRAAYEEKKGKR